MRLAFWLRGLPPALLALGAFAAGPASANDREPGSSAFSIPQQEQLVYRAEWRLMHAGNVRLNWEGGSGDTGWRAHLKLESAGLVSRLYRVDNYYWAEFDRSLCALQSVLKASEGRKRRETLVTYDIHNKKASYLERDLLRNAVISAHEIDIPGCVHDVIAGLYRLRSMQLEPGQDAQLPISDGKKSVLARVQAQERETIQVGQTKYSTVRYEAFLFNNVLYRRRGRLFVWLTDDARRLPVQIRIRLPFYIGTVTLALVPEKSILLEDRS